MNTQTPERDFYTDRSVLLNPYDWFEEMRAKGYSTQGLRLVPVYPTWTRNKVVL